MPGGRPEGGGALDTVIDAETGAFFYDPDPEACAEAIGRCPAAQGTREACRNNALRFGKNVFFRKMRTAIGETAAAAG